MKKKEKRWVRQIIDEFNFDEVRDYYVGMGMVFCGEKNVSTNMLREYARDMLIKLYEEKLQFASCARFTALKMKSGQPVLCWGVDSIVTELEN